MTNAVDLLNACGDQWWSIVASQVPQTAFVGLLMLLLARLFWQAPSHWRYALLLVAVAKFAVPPVATSLPTGVISKLSPLVAPSAIVEQQREAQSTAETLERQFTSAKIRGDSFKAPLSGRTSVNELVDEASGELTLATTATEDQGERQRTGRPRIYRLDCVRIRRLTEKRPAGGASVWKHRDFGFGDIQFSASIFRPRRTPSAVDSNREATG